MPGEGRWVDYAVVGAASLFLLLGIVLFAFGAGNLWRAHASERWPKTTALVTRSETAVGAMPNSQGRTSTVYLADIVFQYEVGGSEYNTTNRHFGQLGGAGDSSEAELILLRYPAQAEVPVSYNPGDPSIAAAEPGFNSDALWIPGAGLAFAVPAVMFVVLWFAMSRGDNRGLAVGMGLFIIFATLGSIFLANGLPNLWRSYLSTGWPQTKGVIVHGSYGKHFVYRYEIGGHTYYSNTRRFSDRRMMQRCSTARYIRQGAK